MSKTFKSAESDNRELEVDVLFGNPRLLVKDFDGDNKGFTFGKATAPALTLAILEAAGYTEAEYVDEWPNVNRAVFSLRLGIEEQEREASRAKEQAELEAEALVLANAFNKTDWDFFPCDRTVEAHQWLAVARKAREMAKEATNGR